MNNLKVDPRESIIKERLSKIKKICLVSGFKGGIGKSLISVMLSLNLAEKKYRVGLLDIDLTSSTDHLILGCEKLYPKENMGLIPPEIKNIKFMSFSFFSYDLPLALRGNSISDAIKELLCVTIWGDLDFLIVDMPPGFSDTNLEVMRLFKNFSLVAVSTPSPLSKKILERMIKVYKDKKKIEIINIENMTKTSKSNALRYDPEVDNAIGNVNKIKKTLMYKDINKISKIIEGR